MNKLWIAMTLAALAAGPVAAGVVYEIEVTDHEQSPPKSESIQAAVEGRNLKMGTASRGSGGEGEMIFRGDRREMIVVDHEKKSYLVMDEKALESFVGQISGAMSELEKTLQNLPEDKRAMVEQMMKGRMPAQAPKRPKNELKKTGERADKNGYPCAKYEVHRGGRKLREIWVTDWDNVEGGKDVAGTFEEMADFFKQMLDAIPDFGQREGAGDPAFEFLTEMGGFPVVTREFAADGSLEGETALRSAKRQTLDPEAFEPPSGYKRQEMLRP